MYVGKYKNNCRVATDRDENKNGGEKEKQAAREGRIISAVPL